VQELVEVDLCALLACDEALDPAGVEAPLALELDEAPESFLADAAHPGGV
jgi:hypothetical protein